MLSEIDFRVLNQLADDDENVSSIVRMLKREIGDSITPGTVLESITKLVDVGFCLVIEVVDLEGRAYGQVISKYLESSLGEYWFRITERGKMELSMSCYDGIYRHE